MSRHLLLAGAALLAVAPAHAQRKRTVIQPYIEASQTLDVDLNGGDAVTYTALAAGVDASIDTARTSAQLSYRYERRFGWEDQPDADIHSGLARVEARVAPVLTIEAGAIATRARADIRGDAPGVLAGAYGNISQIYSAYAGPTLATQTGPVNLNALYRIGYTKAETPGAGGLIAGQPRLDYYDDSVSQAATGSVGVAPRAVLPVGLTASAGWEQERAGQLSQHYDDWFVRGDVLAPIAPTVALAGGVGYEKLTTSQRSPLLTAAGAPVLDADGRFVTDPNSPRRVTYRTDGVYYDAGVVWRPSRRTSVSAYAGKRYGTESYTGTITYQASQSVGFAAQVYDTVTTFGRQLRQGLSSLPTSFVTTRDQFSQAFTGCIYGTTGAAPGGCLNDVFQSVSTASYRARGIDAVLSATRGVSTYGVGAGYSNRKLFQPNNAPGVVLYGLEDESWYGSAFFHRDLSPVSGVDAQAFVNYYDPALAGSADVLSAGATASYYHDFGRLGTTASIGVYHFRVGDGLESAWRGQALLGARYIF